jgi:Zn-dependent peptidase ImmA (M78 family)
MKRQNRGPTPTDIMARVSLNADVLRWIIDRSGESLESLRKRFKKISDWIDGSGEPTLRQVEELAQATMTPLGWFFLDKPMVEELPIPFFRTLTDKSVRKASPELFETIYTIQRRQEWMREYLVSESEPPLAFVNSVRPDVPSAQIADKMRTILGFSEDWASRANDWEDAQRRLRRAIEDARIFVVINSVVGYNTSRGLNPEEFRGFVLVDDYAPFVFVNGADVRPAQMFTLAHELAHVFFGKSAVFDLRELRASEDSIERICNDAAAEFLVPEKLLKQIWPSSRNKSARFKELSARFKVSQVVIARRALDLGMIGKREFSEFYRVSAAAWRNKQRKSGGIVPFYVTLPLRIGERFGGAVLQALRDGAIQYTEAYSLTGLNRQTFDKFAEGVE